MDAEHPLLSTEALDDANLPREDHIERADRLTFAKENLTDLGRASFAVMAEDADLVLGESRKAARDVECLLHSDRDRIARAHQRRRCQPGASRSSREHVVLL